MEQLIIGIDTGGTCTDAVLFDRSSQQVIDTAKVATTHHNLSEGISNAIQQLMAKSLVSPSRIQAVSVSTTLATNSVVENKGARVGLFVIGYVKHFKLPVTAVFYLKGGHTIQGAEEEPLELDYLVDTLRQIGKEVDSYALCSAMSMHNPTHELVAEKAISMIDPKPVFCSHRASQQAGMKERAATAALHAKLMPGMNRFIENMGESLTDLEFSCPVSIVTGDGNTMSPENAADESGRTAASGPACTAVFGAQHCGNACLVIDVGGTTTDIALVEDGVPVLSDEGCSIGSWTTHIPSIDMHTGGVGGDSLVTIRKDRSISIGPGRVTPLAMSPETAALESWLGLESAARRYTLVSRDVASESKAIDYIKQHGSASSEQLADALSLSTMHLERQLEPLLKQSLLMETGFTPTDALHAMGLATFGNQAKAVEGAEILAGQSGSSVEEFCSNVMGNVEDMIVHLILEYVMRRTWSDSMTNFLSTCRSHPLIQTHFSLRIPLVGIGAAAPFFLPAVAEKLATTVTFPQFCEVGNAVGAALCFSSSGQSPGGGTPPA